MGPDTFDEECDCLNRIILEIVLRDFEPFEAIAGEASKSSSDEGIDGIREDLRILLARGLVGAFLIHIEPPYATPVDPQPDEMERYWYTITPAGRRYLQPQPESDARVIYQ